MKNYIMGFLVAYTLSITWFSYGMYNGFIASIQQACVERVSPAPVDFVNGLQGRK